MVGQSKTAMVVVAILVAACASEAVGETTTTSAVADVEPTTTTREVTTTTLPQVVEIPGRAMKLEEGNTYTVSDFIVPMAFTPAEEGWKSFGAETAWVGMTWLDPESVEESVSLLVVAHRPSDSIEVVVDSIIGVDGVEVQAAPVDATVAGEVGVSFEVEGLPHDLPQAQACSGGSGFFFSIHPLGLIGDGGYREYGVPACGLARVWVVGAEGSTVTFLASTLQFDRFDEFMAVVERLLDSMTFEAP